jgi:Fe-S-cluster-containing hydrogenase component 2
MEIDHRKCVACANCIPTCPMGAIYIDTAVNRATVSQASVWSATPATGA